MKTSRLVQADTLLFNTDYLGIFETSDGYTYVHEMKAADGCKVAVVPYAFLPPDNSFFCLAVVERCRPDDTMPQVCSMTGKCEVEDLDDLRLAALRELKEEAGIEAEYWDLNDFGIIYPSKSMDTKVYAFGVDVTGKNIQFGEALGDGTEAEENMTRKWLDIYQIADCTDPILHAVVYRLFADTGYLTQ